MRHEKEDRIYQLLKTSYDVIRLRDRVSIMSYVAESVCLVRFPRIYHGND